MVVAVELKCLVCVCMPKLKSRFLFNKCKHALDECALLPVLQIIRKTHIVY